MAKLKNINFMSKERFDSLSEFSDDELYAVRSHVVVETYKNGDDWYRVYSDGWVEQGGRLVPSTSWRGIVLLKPMVDSYYSVMVTNCGEDATRYAVKAGSPSKNTATTVYVTAGNASTGVFWEVKGQGA